MGQRRWLVTAMAVAAVLLGPPAGAQGAAGDSVTGSGTAELTVPGVGAMITPFEIDVRSGPSGEGPTGYVSMGLPPGPVTCLEVRTVAFSPPFNAATMNIPTTELGLVTLHLSDGGPEGLPDTIEAQLFSDRSPTDCTPLAFGSGDVRGVVLTGDIAFVDVAPGPASKEQCRDGGFARFGFENQGRCVASLRRPAAR